MSKPNLTLAAFCANLARINLEDYVQITLYLPKEEPNERGDQESRYVTLKTGADGRNLAIYGQWYVTSIDLLGEDKGFDLLIEENPPY